ncbi:MAG: zinc ABC transporter substrate-binding protein [candidate division FCPU426 bacterium]
MRTLAVLWLLGCLLGGPALAGAKTLRVVTTLFPWFDFARTIGQDQAEVSLLLPPGVEAHTYAPTPRDLERIAQADVFIYSGPSMEPWVEDLLAGLQLKHTRVVNVSEGVKAGASAEPHAGGIEHSGHDNGPDPHFWLDPQLASQAVTVIEQALSAQAPDQAKVFHLHAGALRRELASLDAEIAQGLQQCRSRELVSAGHSAFAYFARRYHLHMHAAYPGFSPNAEPSPRALAHLVEDIRRLGVRTIFYEELIEPRVARALAAETGVAMLPLHGAHNLSAADRERGLTYLQLMRENLRRLKQGLGCEP